MIVLVG